MTAHVPDEKPWAIYDDLSGVANVGQGGFRTEAEATDRLIEMLEGQRARIAKHLATVKRRRARLRKVQAND